MQKPSEVRAVARHATSKLSEKVWLAVGFATVAFLVLVMLPHLMNIEFSAMHAAGISAAALALVPFGAVMDRRDRAFMAALSMVKADIRALLHSRRRAVDTLLAGAIRRMRDSRRPPRPAASLSGHHLAHICLAPRMAQRPRAPGVHAG